MFIAEKLGAKTFGFEISLPSYLRAQWRIKKDRLKTKIYFKNFYQADLSDADIVFCFLTTQVIGKVEKLLTKQLKAGTIIATYGATFSELQPTKTINGKIWTNGNVSKINFFKI